MYHFGVLVYNLEEAIERFSDLFGLTFNDPTDIRLNRLADPDEHPFDLRATYSRQGPPFMELLEANGNGVYGAHHGEGLHHVGLWDPSIATNKSMYIDKKNMSVEGEVLLPTGDVFAWYAKSDTAHGVRFEFVDEAARADQEKWIATGEVGEGGFVV
jgi:catechol 2,3-dioxygenase-like lactoylglutathione lyase family enzyme